MSRSFDGETALTPVGPGTYAGAISEHWSVGAGPNGGYVSALLLRAMKLMLADETWHPRSLTAHYVSAPAVGPVVVHVTLERQGRRVTSLSARMEQDGKLRALALGAFAIEMEGPRWQDATMPKVPPPENLPEFAAKGFMPTFAENYDYRPCLGDPPFSGSAHSLMGGWMRLRERRVADDLLMTALTDSWPPAIYPRLTQPMAAPTIDLTIHFRANFPLDGATPEDFYLAVFSARVVGDGFFEEDGDIWTRDGRLVAQSRQLAMLFVRPDAS